MESGENEPVFISEYEFANIVEVRKIMKNFSGNQKRPKQTPNKFESVITEVIGSKYDNVHLDWLNCSEKERNKLRSSFKRLETRMTKNLKRGKPLSHEFDPKKPFFSKELYKTIIVQVVFSPSPSRNER